MLLRAVLDSGPLLFGLGFIAPLMAQLLEMAAVNSLFGLSSLAVGLLVGGALGLLATVRGRWV